MRRLIISPVGGGQQFDASDDESQLVVEHLVANPVAPPSIRDKDFSQILLGLDVYKNTY